MGKKLYSDTDGNGHGLLNTSVGLATYDELKLGGSILQHYGTAHDQDMSWTTNHSGYSTNNMPQYWVGKLRTGGVGSVGWSSASNTFAVRLNPVINIKTNVRVTGRGSLADPYVIH